MTVEELYDQIGGSYESAKRILQMDMMIDRFIRKFAQDKSFQELMDAYAARDDKGIFQSAHALKGVSANLGLDSLSAMASEIADEFRPGKDRKMSNDVLAGKIDALKAQYSRTQEGIKQFSAG